MINPEHLNDWSGYLSYKPTIIYKWLCEVEEDIVCIFSGNQMGKNRTVAQFIFNSMLGLLPVPHRNITPEDSVRVIRFCSEILPMSEDESEVKNTQYPAIRSIIPDNLLKSDVTIRKPQMSIIDRNGGKDITIEYVSYSQSVQRQAGVQRRMIWIDESASKSFYEEQLPRLLKASSELRQRYGKGGAMLIVTLTPAQEYLGWEYDELYERADKIYRTPAVCKRIKERMGEDALEYEERNNGTGIAVLMAATDDNPTLDAETIENMYNKYADEDVIDIRRYGLFKQISGIVFKNFDFNTHVIDFDKYFPTGVPYEWLHARGIDYHQENPWAVGWCVLSPQNEMFIYDELYPSPEKTVTLDIARMIAFRSKDYKFWLNLIDPLADNKQNNTGLSTLDDLNRIFYELRREGIGTGGFWQTWDTKSTYGRDELKLRFKNSRLVGRPFNNMTKKDGQEIYLPTIWISRHCKNTIEHIRNWRREQHINRNVLVYRDPKDKLQERYSHFCMVYECILKSPAFSINRYKGSILHDRKRRLYNGFSGL